MSDANSSGQPGDSLPGPAFGSAQKAAEGLGATARRRPLYVIFLAIGVVLGGAAVLATVTRVNTAAAVAPSNPSASPTDATSVSSAAASYQAQVATILEEHLPQPISKTCHQQDKNEAQDFAIISVTCSAASGGAPITVQYSWFHDGKAQRERFTYDKNTHLGAEARKGNLASCVNAPIYGTWWMAEVSDSTSGDAPHSVTANPPRSATGGGALCYQAGDSAFIEWYDNDTRIYGWASTQRQAAAELYSWWVHSAGPWHPAMNMGTAMTPSMTPEVDPAAGPGSSGSPTRPTMSPTESRPSPSASMSSNM